MATINYNGMELEEVTIPQIFDPPIEMVVCDKYTEPKKAKVFAILAPSCELRYRVIASGDTYGSCALLPDPPKPRRATNRELARWLAQGNGEAYCGVMTLCSYYPYDEHEENDDVYSYVKVRKWEDTEWHEPTVDYLGIDDKDCDFNKKYKGD